jgi:hypothetical protein
MQLNIKDIVPEPKVATDWRLSKISNKLRPKSLSDLLKDIPEFQRELLPNSRQAITQINRALRKNQFIAPSEETKKGNLYSSVALAIDRGALMLRDEIDNNRLITTLKIHNKYGNKKYKDHRNAIVIIINKFESIAQNEPFSKETAGYLFLLGKLEPIIRGFRPFSDVIEHGLPSNLSTDSIRNWLSDIISADLSSEIIDLLNVISKLQLKGHFFANPIFGGIGPISGSDGDWITGETLVELKCTVRGVKREYVAQIICYSALNKIGPKAATIPPINKLALCLPRQSSIVVGSVDEWLSAFGAPPSEFIYKSIEEYFSSYKA